MINRPLAGPLLPRSPGRRHGRASRRSRPSAITRLASSVGSQSLRAPVRTARPSMSASSPDAPPVVDVHAHLVPERAFERVPAGMRAERVEGADEIRLAVHGPRGAGRGAPPELRDLELHRRRQQRRGIGLSLVGPWIDMVKAPDEPALQQAWCRVLNEELAAATGASGHSRWLAALPDLDGARAGQELERAAAAGAVGGMLAANPEHGTLARSDLEWLWRAAERLRLPLVLHPGEFKPPPRLAEHFMVNLVGNPFETTLAAGSLLAAGVPERHPDLQVVLVHGGGFLPYQYARMAAGFQRWPRLRELQRRSPAELLRWFHYDTVVFDDPPTRYLLELVGDDRVLAGSDCPFTMEDTRPFDAPERLGLDQAGRDRVLGGNAVLLCGITDLPLRPVFGAYNIPAMRMALDGVPVYPRSVLIRRPELAAEMLAAMGDSPVCVLRGHGITVAGETVVQAVVRALDLNALASVTLELARLRRAAPEIPAEDVADLPDLGSAFNDEAVWRYHVAKLDGAPTPHLNS